MASNKPKKLKARLPRGFEDRIANEIAATERMLRVIRTMYELYGFELLETPAIEFTDVLGKFLPDQDRPNEGVFSFQDDDKQWLSLRYDLTAPLARYVAENFDALSKPYRSYRYGWVFRNEKPGPGRYRQFMQFDADTVGTSSIAADAEMCMMAADTMEALGIKRGDYVIKVNNRKVLDGVLESIGLGGESNAGKRLAALRAFDKLDRLGTAGVRALLGEGRKDESGDVTKGAGLNNKQIEFLLNFLKPVYGYSIEREGVLRPYDDMEPIDPAHGDPQDRRRKFIDNFVTLTHQTSMLATNQLGMSGLQELGDLSKFCESSGYGSRRIKVDPSVVRGLEYYTGPVFEAEITREFKYDTGKPLRIGSVGGGGRYDGLISRFRGELVPATGFSIGVSRLRFALSSMGRLDISFLPGPVIVTILDEDRIDDYQRMVKALRESNIPAELYLGSGKMGQQFKYADKRNAPCVVIQGSEEKNDRNGPQVIVKDLILGAELTRIERDRDEYLQKQEMAERRVPENQLIKAVREVLARHGISHGH